MATHTTSSPETDLSQVVLVVDAESQIWVDRNQQFSAVVRAAVNRIRNNSSDRYYDLVLKSSEEIANKKLETDEDAIDVPRTQSDMERVASDLFARAVISRASDIHVRVHNRERTKVLFRVHGDLRPIESHPSSWGQALCSTIYHSLCDVADSVYDASKRQDARIANKAVLPGKLDGIRIATTPVVDGSLMVMRLLYDNSNMSDNLCEIGYTMAQQAQLQVLKKRPTGMIVISGPTGSGKSTTLSRSMRSLIRETNGNKHIITVEDPPEYPIPGSSQTPVANADTEEERSVAFQLAIKASMRLDPDVIMIGEMRDPPSATLAFQAATTGHQVWSTLHANGAFHIIARLLDMGADMNTLADPGILSGLISQRLLKSLCPKCKQPLTKVWSKYSENIPNFDEEIKRIGSVASLDDIYVAGEGCNHKDCDKGIVGRTAVAEVVVTDHRLMEFLQKHDIMGAINYWKEHLGGMSMVEHALLKVKHGLVDPFDAENQVGHLDGGASMVRKSIESGVI